jgi:hypothetical protein
MAFPIFADPGVLQGTSAYYQVETKPGFVEYVSFSNVLTESIESKPLRDSFKTDQIGTSVVLKFKAVASSFAIDSVPTDPADRPLVQRTGVNTFDNPEFGYLTDPTNITTKAFGANTNTGDLERLLRICSSIRGRFIYKIGNSVLYDVHPRMGASGVTRWGGEDMVGIAVNQTPDLEVSVDKIISNNTAHVSVVARFDYIRCTDEGLSREHSLKYRSNVKSLRWYYADNIDTQTWMTSRHYRGRLELYDRDVSAQSLRYLVLPPIALGFKRTGINLEESSDGMSLDFEVVDQEVFATPVHPLSHWEGQTTINFPKLLIGKANVECNLTAHAPRHIPKMKLADWATRIIDAKIHWFNSVSYSKSVFTERFSVADNFSDNKIDMSVRLSFIVPATESQGSQGTFNGIRNTIDAVINNDLSFDPGRTVGIGVPERGYDDNNESGGPGHSRGIRYYSPLRYRYAYPNKSSLFGIIYCALQNPCSMHLNTPAWLVPPDEDPVKPGDRSPSPGTKGPSGGDGGDEPEEGDWTLPLPKDGQPDNGAPYTQYEIETSMFTDMGIKTFSPMNNIRTLGGFDASRIVHQSNAPTETVTMILDAKRLNRWPNGPNELSFQDPVTKIYYICESVDTIASTAVQDALRNTVEYSLKAVVKYQLSRHHKHFEDKLVFTPPFIEEVIGGDRNAAAALRGYYQSIYSKSGFEFKPRGDEDNGPTGSPPSDGGGGDTPIRPY